MKEPSSGDIWELETFGLSRRSERRAWAVAVVGCVLGFLGLANSAYSRSQHQIEPVIMTVDKQTGLVEMPSRLGHVTLDEDEAITQSYLYRYVRDRETYDYRDNVMRIEGIYGESQGQAKESLSKIWRNVEADHHPYHQYGETGVATVQIKSISFIDEDTASVRFVKTARAGAGSAKRDYVAILDFMYDRGKDRPLALLWKNPLGFYVTRYRLDAETLVGEGVR